MGKRQRSDYRDDGASSTESNDDMQSASKMNGGENCIHIPKAVDLPTIRKKIKSSGFDKLCGKCAQDAVIYSASAKVLDGGAGVDCTLWLCLKCGSQLCGRNRNQHALQHYTHSDVHALAMNTSTFDVWCYGCNVPVDPSAKPMLHDIVEFSKQEAIKLRGSTGSRNVNDQNGQVQITTDSVRKLMIDVLQSTPMTSSVASVDVPDAAKLGGNTQPYENRFGAGAGSTTAAGVDTVGAAQAPPVQPLSQDTRQPTVERNPFAMTPSYKPNVVDPLSRVRGLSNLGNTCFFNAVLQCLARTPYLLSVLNESAVEGEKVQIPGGTLKLPDGTEKLLPAIDGELEAWRSLTGALAGVLIELTSGASRIISPNRLLNELTGKWPQFDGGDQHDAHELLRHLLESVRTDDLRRYQALILHSFRLDKRESHQNVDENLKAMVRFYGDQISQWVFRPEQVFRGSLVSTLKCQDCQHTSSRHEYFLDISLPVCAEKPQAPVLRKGSPEPDGSNGMALIALPAPAPAAPLASAEGNAVAAKALSKKERDREKKAKRIAKHQKNRINLSSVGIGGGTGAFSLSLPAADTAGVSDVDADMPPMLPLTDDVPAAVGAGAEESTDDSREPSDADVEDNDLVDNSFVAKTGGGDADSAPTVDQNGNQAQPRSSIPEKMDDSPENPNKEPDGASNIVCAVGISAQRATQIAKQLQQNGLTGSSETEGECMTRDGPRSRHRTYSYADWSNPIAPRYQCEDGEYSVQSCFNIFTAPELMTGNNKVCCVACTERINGKDGKSVNTNATKQFLISVPPAVLILHLKRFQLGPRGMFRKLSDRVTFPFVLDIAPFCGSKVKRASHIRPGQKKILYSLYGLVEHSGSMQTGHYVAYVKVRPPFGSDDVRWKFIPQGTKDELDRKTEQEMAKEQARRMGVHLHDSDDSLSSAHSDSEGEAVDQVDGPFDNIQQQQQQQQRKRPEAEDQEDEEEGAVGYTRKPPEPAPEVQPPPGKWYCVSDTTVHEVSEESVLMVQAYLLFYERIF
uniref:Ubiquitinyl hydrolase 1 n=1 Tax=Anopheles atroparvus TaxID=41427 RepID=A0A182IYS2_ANOAO